MTHGNNITWLIHAAQLWRALGMSFELHTTIIAAMPGPYADTQGWKQSWSSTYKHVDGTLQCWLSFDIHIFRNNNKQRVPQLLEPPREKS